MTKWYLISFCIILYLQRKCAFEAPNSGITLPTGIAYYLFCVFACNLFGIHIRTCNKVVHFLFNFVFMVQISFKIYYYLGLTLVVHLSLVLHLWYCTLCSEIVVLHSPLSLIMLVHYPALLRNCIKTQYSY